MAVRGEEEEAKKWIEEKEKEEKQGEEEVDISKDDEVVEQDSVEDDGESKKKRGKISSKASAQKEAILNFHPLSVAIIVRSKSSSEVKISPFAIYSILLPPGVSHGYTAPAACTGSGNSEGKLVRRWQTSQ